MSPNTSDLFILSWSFCACQSKLILLRVMDYFQFEGNKGVDCIWKHFVHTKSWCWSCFENPSSLTFIGSVRAFFAFSNLQLSSNLSRRVGKARQAWFTTDSQLIHNCIMILKHYPFSMHYWKISVLSYTVLKQSHRPKGRLLFLPFLHFPRTVWIMK